MGVAVVLSEAQARWRRGARGLARRRRDFCPRQRLGEVAAIRRAAVMDSERRRRALLGYARGTTGAEPMAHLASKGTVSAASVQGRRGRGPEWGFADRHDLHVSQ